MGIQWAAEACDRRFDPVSGAMITYLTSSACSSINIYCEQPYTSPDSRRIAIMRRYDVSFDASWRLLVADLQTLRLALVEREGVVGVCNAAWSGLLLYAMADGTLRRVDLNSLAVEEVPLPSGCELRGRGVSVSPDQRYIVYSRVVDGPEVGIFVVDLEAQSESLIFQHPEITNPHLQFNPVHGRDILVQHNRGSTMAADGTITCNCGPAGTTHFVISRDGSNRRPLPAGPPHTGPSTGHSNFVADTGRVVWAAHWDQSDWSLGELNRGGNLFIAQPGDTEATAFPAPEHRFNHVNVSRCGRYFVCDSVPESLYVDGEIRSPSLVIGNLATGKHRVLVADTMASNGGGQHQHPHAYLTADNTSVIYNSDPNFSPTQVCAARVPDGFLASLD
jgi:hypothetical protein